MNKIQINQRVIFIGLVTFDEKQPFFNKNITNKRRNTLIKNGFIHAPTPEAEEKLSIMKLPEDEQKAYEHYKDDLHYQASMFESSFGDGYSEGKAEGIVEGINETTKNIALNLIKEGVTIDMIAKVTGLPEAVISNLHKLNE